MLIEAFRFVGNLRNSQLDVTGLSAEERSSWQWVLFSM
jgi:hypothetical protein